MNRTERLLDLVALLLAAREPVSFAELREAFPADYGTGSREACERKLERDKAELLHLGVPIEFVAGAEDREIGGYRIDRGAFFLADPGLSPEESAALYAAGSAALATRDFPFAQDLEHALRKLVLTGRVETAGSRRLLIVRPGDPGRAGKLKLLGQAVARRKRVDLRYRSAPAVGREAAPAASERTVDPYGIAFRGGAWRLVGYCHLRKAVRVFLVDRIEEERINELRPSQPDFEPPAGFDAPAVAGKRPWEWGESDPVQVRLAFAAGSELLATRAFDQDLEAESERAGGKLQLAVTHVDGLLQQLLPLGDRVWVESPASVRGRAETILRTLADRLSSPPSPQPARGTVAGAEAPMAAQPHAEAASEPPGAKGAKGAAASAGRTREKDGDASQRERLRRLLLVVPAVLRKPGIRIEDLARQLGFDPAELLSDIDLLAMVGHPPFSPDDLIDISVDEAGRVRVALDQSFSRPPQLTPLEALALGTAAHEVAPADSVVLAALGKLTASLPAPAQRLYEALASRIAAATEAPRGVGPLLVQLRTCAERLREVTLEYDKEGRGKVQLRTLEPRAVIEHGGRWYVFGRDPERQADRTFRLDRVRAVSETGRAFADPGPVDVRRFERESLFVPAGGEEPVVVRFSPAAAHWARATFGRLAHPCGPGAEGSVDVTLQSAGYGYAVSLALSCVGEAEIVDPPGARYALRAEVQQALQRYAPGSPTP